MPTSPAPTQVGERRSFFSSQHPVCPSPLVYDPGRFWEDQIRDKEVLLEKVILKNSTYKAAITKLEAQLAHKEEMGEVCARG